MKNFIKNEFITVTVNGDSFNDQVKEIETQVNEMCDRRIKEVEAKASQGIPEAILEYNVLTSKDAQIREYLTHYFVCQLSNNRRVFEV